MATRHELEDAAHDHDFLVRRTTATPSGPVGRRAQLGDGRKDRDLITDSMALLADGLHVTIEVIERREG